MANLNLMLARDATEGKSSEYIYAVRNNRMYFYRRSSRASMPESQRQVIDKFRLGALYAKGVKADPEQRAFYEGLAASRGSRLHVVIMTDYLKAPVVKAIDLGGFQGVMGDPIRVTALDDAQVVAVTVQIRGQDGTLLEEGAAIEAGDKWVYATTVAHPADTPVTITATAVDRPGNQGTGTERWGPAPSE
jgi:hypothetical protein